MTQQDLVPVHGGLTEPVDRIVSFKDQASFLAEAGGLPSIRVTAADLSTVYRLADGALSPLIGPMKKEAYDLVISEMVVLSEGGRYAWTIPISLPVTDGEAESLSAGGACAVQTEDGKVVAIIEDLEVFDWDKIADPDCTLVIYMGLTNLEEICARLVQAGLDESTPAAAIHGGTTGSQQKVISRLA